MEETLEQAKVDVKQLRGIFKILQLVLSICALATTASFVSSFTFNIFCTLHDSNHNQTVTVEIVFPFQLDRTYDPVEACGASTPLIMRGDFSSHAWFFVAVGVLALLYVLFASGLYCFFNDFYENDIKVPIVDFGVHVIFVILWLAASCTWIFKVFDLESVVTLDDKLKDIEPCMKYVCEPVTEASFKQLIISVIFGFINALVWSGNLLLFCKKIKPHKDKKPAERVSSTETPLM